MARALHLVKTAASAITLAAIGAGVEDGDDVTVALLPGGQTPELSARVTVRRVPQECSWEELFDLVYEADSVVAW